MNEELNINAKGQKMIRVEAKNNNRKVVGTVNLQEDQFICIWFDRFLKVNGFKQNNIWFHKTTGQHYERFMDGTIRPVENSSIYLTNWKLS